jgi:arginase
MTKDLPNVLVLAVPYDSGHRGLRMGGGPEHLLANGLCDALRTGSRSVRSELVHHEDDPPAEVATAFELDRLVSRKVRTAVSEGEFPLVLSGNCNTSVGTLAGAGPEGLGIVWLDAHADFNTPETTSTGFTDGMGLAIAVGHCWKTMAEGVPGFSPVAEENVVLAGVRNIDPAERERLDASRVGLVGADRIGREGLRALGVALDALRTRVSRVYVHLDLDVLDAGNVGKANQFATRGGLSAEDLEAALGMVRERFAVAACGIASYDPTFDSTGRVLRAALSCARRLALPAEPPTHT